MRAWAFSERRGDARPALQPRRPGLRRGCGPTIVAEKRNFRRLFSSAECPGGGYLLGVRWRGSVEFYDPVVKPGSPMRLAFALAAMAVAAGPAKAYYLDGNGLYSFCQNDRNLVSSYIIGATDAFTDNFTGEVKRICLPASVTIPQITDTYCKFLQDHPERRNLPASGLAYQMLIGFYSCSG